MVSPLARAALVALPLVIAACGGASSQSGADPQEGAATGDGETAARQDMVMGDENAPVTVIEFASVTCPACANFHQTMFPQIKENYIDTGKVKFVFREFPTPPAGLSYVGSVLARCAADRGGQDAYFVVLNALFKTQRTWVSAEDPKAELLKIAGQAGMDETAFDACMKREELVDLINDNVEEASDRYQVNSTPSFIVDGEKITIRSVEDLETALDSALAAAG